MSKILLVDDDKGFTEATRQIIELLGHETTVADSISSALLLLHEQRFDLLLLDIMLPDGNGLDLLDKVPADSRPEHIAFITGHTAIKSLIKSVTGPDVSYLLKPIDIDSIRALLERATHIEDPDNSCHFGVLVGESLEMRAVYDMISKVGPTSANVMIQGESGTGKELVAQAIHNASSYNGPFVATNCGAMSPELLSSELFGHERGAFTGAISRKIGLFEQAKNGTLFLDEITEMPIEMQPTLLRVLETGKITRVGGSEEIAVNCRVVSATNRTREQLAQDNCLREDIYFRLAVFPIDLPPLRERKDDIPRLSQFFLEQMNEEHNSTVQIDEATMARLIQCDWPGNVREFRHALFRAFILTGSDERYLRMPEQLGSPFSSKKAPDSSLRAGTTIQQIEKELISLTLQKVDGDKPKAAEMLGISLKTLYNRLNQYQKED